MVERIPGSDPATGRLGEGPDYYFTSMVVAADVLRSIGPFDESYVLGDDMEMVFRMRRRGIPLQMVDEPYAIRHIHAGNASHDEALMAREFLRTVRTHRGAVRP